MAIAANTTILQKYHVLRLIGEGGNGRVWLAEEITFNNRFVAIKEPRTDLPPEDQLELQRIYRQEVQLTGALEQAGAPNVVRTFTVEPYEDRPLLVMAYMPGGDLARKLQEHSPLPLEQALAVTRAILASLQVVHDHPLGIVHRDIKPQNILFDAAGNAHLSDFGLAQVGSTSGRSQLSARTHPGSPLYMAPEQARSTDYLTPAADIFAVGCVLFEMVTGKPYKRVRPGTPASVLRTETPAWLDDGITKALAEDPFDRYEDASALAAALQPLLPASGPAVRSQPPAAHPPTVTPQPQPSSRARLFGISALLVLLVASGLIYGFGGDLLGGLMERAVLSPTASATYTVTVAPLAAAPMPPEVTATPHPTMTPSATDTARPTPTSRPPATATTPPTPTAALAVTQTAPEVVINTLINVRSGPSTAYTIIGSASPGERYPITGKDAAGAWWQIDFNSQAGWVFGQLVSVQNGQDVGVVQVIPTLPAAAPTPTPTSVLRPTATFAPTPTPLVLAPASETDIKATVAAAAGLATATPQLQQIAPTPTPP